MEASRLVGRRVYPLVAGAAVRAPGPNPWTSLSYGNAVRQKPMLVKQFRCAANNFEGQIGLLRNVE